MKNTPAAIVIGLLIHFVLAQDILAFPGKRHTLADRWAESDLVVLAKVISAKRIFSEGHAVLSSIEVLKGDPQMRTDEIRLYSRLGACGCPVFNFADGEKAIAFLEFDSDRKMYKPVGASYGCIVVNERNFPHYIALLKKLPAILAHENAEARSRLLMEWYVECAIYPDTRWEGTWGIAWLRDGANAKTDPLTSSHKSQLVAALLLERPPEQDADSIVELIAPYASPDLDRYLLESLRCCHEPGWQYLTRAAVENLPDRLGIELDQSTQERLEDWGELLGDVYYHIDQEAEPDRHEQEKERLDILWGSLAWQIYIQCKDAMEKR